MNVSGSLPLCPWSAALSEAGKWMDAIPEKANEAP